MRDLEHPSITRTLLTGYPQEEPITVCANPNCEAPIYKGDRVWRKGHDLFCQSECLIDSFQSEED